MPITDRLHSRCNRFVRRYLQSGRAKNCGEGGCGIMGQVGTNALMLPMMANTACSMSHHTLLQAALLHHIVCALLQNKYGLTCAMPNKRAQER